MGKKIFKKPPGRTPTSQQQGALEDLVGAKETVFQKIFSEDPKRQERALMTLASVSLGPHLALDQFYSPELLKRLLELANQLTTRTTLFAIDAIKNLCVQAYLMGKDSLATHILKEGGFLDCLLTIIDKALTLLKHEHALPLPQKSPHNHDLYTLAIEQCYLCLTELVHFIEQGPLLQHITVGPLVTGSLSLLTNWTEHPYLGMKLFKRIAAFLRELSLDNEYIASLDGLDTMVEALVDSLFIENAEFACNLLAYSVNVQRYSGRLRDVGIVGKCVEKVFGLEEGVTPQQYFMKQFGGKYKLAEEKKGDEEESDDNMEEVAEADGKEDAVTSSIEFRKWRSMSKAYASVISLLNDLVQYATTSPEDEDEEFEEVDGDEDFKEESKTEEVGASPISAGVNALARMSITHILSCGKAITQFLGLTQETEDLLDEVQEASLSLVLTVLQNTTLIGPSDYAPILDVIHEFLHLSLYKCERNVFDTLLSLLRYLIDNNKALRPSIISSELLTKIIRAGNYTQGVQQRIQLVQILQTLLTTEQAKHTVFTTIENVQEVTEMLVQACKSGNLLLISHALDAFYDIFSENNYNQALADKQVIQMMKVGLPHLQGLYKGARSEKQMSKRELRYADQALENLPAFIEYKVREMGVQQ
ncbi:hypothetical protein FGO68_gene4081 [Halteria grandinella]|uniref:SYO1-like TPR repeats domain-containing protein n=1 Tax=Halteria grandinella TaxID=5974 RepID=A0A8J8T4S4_HALGN|nr:hypothetical protein FGO68_gene4081 [Halteria grandinella]